jgi:tetratricopeptide (TPR) repeat protein
MNSIPRFLIPALLIFFLSACAGTAGVSAPMEPTAQEDEALPQVALDSGILYDLLLGEIAGHRGQVAVAATLLGKVAQKTRDPRIAERATLAALYAKHYDEALKSAELWVELRPQDSEAREALALTLLESGRPAEAQFQLEKILSLEAARNNIDQAYLRAASLLGRYGNRLTALEIMQTLVRLHPQLPSAHLYLAHLAVRAGELNQAGTHVDRALALRPDWEEAALFRVRVHISQKDVSQAQSFYEQFLDRYPEAANVRLNYARFLIDQKQWEKAHKQFKRVIAVMPEDADAIYAVGLLSLQINRLDEAEEYLKRALEIRPQNDQARIYLGQVAEGGKRYDEATRWYTEIGPGEQYFEAQTRLGMLLAKQGDLAAARKHLQAIQPQTDPQRVQRALAEEQILRDAKQYQEALEVLNQAIRTVPGDKDLLYARALVAEKLDMVDVAERDLRAILAKDPKNANALNALGYTLADRTTRYQEAHELLQEAVALKPDDPFILDSMGWVQYRLGNSTEAIRYLKRALELRNDAEIAAHLGEVLWVTGNRNEAESVWNRALHGAPDSEALHGVIKKFKP